MTITPAMIDTLCMLGLGAVILLTALGVAIWGIMCVGASMVRLLKQRWF